MELSTALALFKAGTNVDFRQSCYYDWKENPFRKTGVLTDVGQNSVLIVEAALASTAEFRVRPEPDTRIRVLAKSRGMDYNLSAKLLASACVVAALRDVREHLQTFKFADGFVDSIELDFCGPKK